MKRFTFYDLHYKLTKNEKEEIIGEFIKNVCEYMFEDKEIEIPKDDKQAYIWSSVVEFLERTKELESEGKTPKEGTIVTLFNKMYVYINDRGGHWCNARDRRNSKVETAIKEIEKSNSTTSATTNIEVAQKANSGTLTYNDVVKYCPGIMTPNEFRRCYAESKEYSSYQAYLKAMYEKYR